MPFHGHFSSSQLRRLTLTEVNAFRPAQRSAISVVPAANPT
jgi:hypothetical protein